MIAILADIHANLHALEAVLEDMPQEVREIWLLGDLVGELPFPCQVLDRLMERGRHVPIRAVAGNRELSLLEGKEGLHPEWRAGSQFCVMDWTMRQLKPRHWDYLRSLSPVLALEGVEGGALLCHGSPRAVRDIVHTREEADQAAAGTAQRIIACGHTHQTRLFRLDGKTFCNAGSVGLSLDGVEGVASYALYNAARSGRELSFRFVSYDTEAAARAAETSELARLSPGIMRAVVLELRTGRHHMSGLVDFCRCYAERQLGKEARDIPPDLWREAEALWDGWEYLPGRSQ